MGMRSGSICSGVGRCVVVEGHQGQGCTRTRSVPAGGCVCPGRDRPQENFRGASFNCFGCCEGFMSRASQLHLMGVVSSRGEASAYLKAPGDAVLVERGRPRLLLLSCPCGCGEHFPINLDPRAGPAWRLYRNRTGAITLYPSVWRESGCYSHYIIWRDRILLFGGAEDELDDSMLMDDA